MMETNKQKWASNLRFEVLKFKKFKAVEIRYHGNLYLARITEYFCTIALWLSGRPSLSRGNTTAYNLAACWLGTHFSGT